MPDDLDARLVVLRIDHPYSKEAGNAAEAAAKAIFESRGNTPRLYRNALVFLAADKTRLQDLDEAVRRSISPGSRSSPRRTRLDLDRPAGEAGRDAADAADGTVTGPHPRGLPLAAGPHPEDAPVAIEWQAFRLPSGQDALAVRAARSSATTRLLVTGFAGTGSRWNSTASRSGAATTWR